MAANDKLGLIPSHGAKQLTATLCHTCDAVREKLWSRMFRSCPLTKKGSRHFVVMLGRELVGIPKEPGQCPSTHVVGLDEGRMAIS